MIKHIIKTGSNTQEIAEASRKMQRMCIRDKDNHTNKMCQELEQYANRHVSRELFKKEDPSVAKYNKHAIKVESIISRAQVELSTK